MGRDPNPDAYCSTQRGRSTAERAPMTGGERGSSAADAGGGRAGGLKPKNLRTAAGRTSVRLEAELWDAYDEVCRENGLSRGSLALMIDAGRPAALPFTAAIRIVLVAFFRSRFRNPAEGRDKALSEALAALGGGPPVACPDG